MSRTTTISLRVDNEELERIDDAARREHQTRTEYILSWLPTHYDAPAPEHRDSFAKGANSGSKG